ncbi:MAG: heavy-metal-associated domain-containing protein [Acidobacteria bacterium]|nr:heavy-metal-associated domain-containing protein [Acidobacteriota bacterium]
MVAVLALAFSFYQTYFRREKCGEGQACSTKPIGRFNQIILWAAIVAIAGFAFFPYYSGNIVSALDKPQPTADVSQAAEQPPTDTENAAVEAENQTRKTIVIAVEGMTCEGCASHLGIKLKKIEGVMSAEASYPKKSVTVGYNSKQVRIERIRQGIRDAGYKLK